MIHVLIQFIQIVAFVILEKIYMYILFSPFLIFLYKNQTRKQKLNSTSAPLFSPLIFTVFILQYIYNIYSKNNILKSEFLVGEHAYSINGWNSFSDASIADSDSCPGIWDGWMCWPDTPRNTAQERQCPTFIRSETTEYGCECK